MAFCAVAHGKAQGMLEIPAQDCQKVCNVSLQLDEIGKHCMHSRDLEAVCFVHTSILYLLLLLLSSLLCQIFRNCAFKHASPGNCSMQHLCTPVMHTRSCLVGTLVQFTAMFILHPKFALQKLFQVFCCIYSQLHFLLE